MFKYFMSVLFLMGIFCINGSAAHPHDKEIIIKTEGKPVLGVVIVSMDDDELEELNLHGGAKVKKVMEDSEAERIGLQRGDVIVKFDGSDISDPRDLSKMISKIEEEKKVEIVAMRDGKEKKFEANIKPGDESPVWVWGDDDFEFDFDFDDVPHHFMPHQGKGGFLGVETEELSDQLRKYFEVDHGVLIESVVEDSPAEKAGLKAGDIIYEISGKKIEDYRDLVRTVNYYDPGETVEVKYSRKGRNASVKVELGERKNRKWRQFKSYSNPEHNLYFDEDRMERKLEKNMRHLEDNLKGLENNLKKIERNVAIILLRLESHGEDTN
jgi:C-terminal processing protease CtpA/Prc